MRIDLARERLAAIFIIIMASPAKIQKMNDINEEVTGFLHEISPMKHSARNKVPYFNAVLQTSSAEFHNAVIYANDSTRSRYTTVSMAKTPVKLKNVSRTISYTDPAGFDLKCSNRTTIEPLTESPFKYRHPPEVETRTIQQVKESGITNQYVTLLAKLVEKGLPSQREVRGKNIMLAETTIADHTDSIRLSVWGDVIPTLQVGTSYKMTSLSIRHYNNVTTLTTTAKTQITETDLGPEDVVTTPPEQPFQTFTKGPITSTKVESTTHCISCNRENDVNPKHSMLRCCQCGMKQKTENMKKMLSIKLTIKNTPADVIFTLPTSILTHFLEQNDNAELLSNEESLEEFLLTVPSVEVKSIQNNIITEIKIASEDV